MHIETVLTPAEIARLPTRDLSQSTCVVFDVLRATSTILTAFSRGANRIYPVTTVDQARQLRQNFHPQALLGGERGGVRLAGFDLGNSPSEYTKERVAGRDIITTTTNGTVALQACAAAREVFVGALLNLNALAAHLQSDAIRPVERLFLVCAGTGEDFALEDGFAAGAFAARLDGSRDDATFAMQTLFERHAGSPADVLRASTNGQRLAAMGLGGDMTWCARVSVLDAVGVLRGIALERVAA